MKNLALVLAIISLLALTQMGNAADLQAGWYANIWSVQVYRYDANGMPQLSGAARFQTPLGQHGPFLVTDGPYSVNWQCYTSVPSRALDVGVDQSLSLPMNIGLGIGDRIAFLGFAWYTNYEANQMRLELWQQNVASSDDLVWSQTKSGVQQDIAEVEYDKVMEGPFYFKLNIVPEPSSVLSLLLGCISLAYKAKKRV